MDAARCQFGDEVSEVLSVNESQVVCKLAPNTVGAKLVSVAINAKDFVSGMLVSYIPYNLVIPRNQTEIVPLYRQETVTVNETGIKIVNGTNTSYNYTTTKEIDIPNGTRTDITPYTESFRMKVVHGTWFYFNYYDQKLFSSSPWGGPSNYSGGSCDQYCGYHNTSGCC